MLDEVKTKTIDEHYFYIESIYYHILLTFFPPHTE